MYIETMVQPGDVILVYVDEKPSFYGRVENILPDVKKGWRNFIFLSLTHPIQKITWILEPSQIDGDEFTMGGTPMRIQRLPDAGTGYGDEDDGEEEEQAEIIKFPSGEDDQ